MPIHYALHENNLTSDPNDYGAQVQFTASVDLGGLVKQMIYQGSMVPRSRSFLILASRPID